MLDEDKKSKSIIKKSASSNLLDGTWYIIKIVKDVFFIDRYQNYGKTVSFSKNIEVNHIENDKIVKSLEKMDKYGEPPNPKMQLYEHYLLAIARVGDIHLSKFNFMNSLRTLKLYYFFMGNFINTHYLLGTKGKKMIYSKKTLIKSPQLLLIDNFLKNKTNLLRKLEIIRKFYIRYCVK